MNGIDYVIDVYSLDRKNPSNAIERLKELDLSMGTANHFIQEAIDDDNITLPDNKESAINVLAQLIQMAAKSNTRKFSTNSYMEALHKPNIIKVIESAQPAKIPPVIISAPKSVTVKPVIIENPTEGRTRKLNPNSNVNQAKILYNNSVDKSRDTIVKLFCDTLKLNAGTAMTYYYIAKKG